MSANLNQEPGLDLWADRTLPRRHAWLALQCGQIRSPTHSLSKVISHLRHRRGLRMYSLEALEASCDICLICVFSD
jgi:hypothetical protein